MPMMIRMLFGCCLLVLPWYGDCSLAVIKSLKPHYAVLEKGRLEYYTFGSGSPLLLVNGYGTDVSSWDKRFLGKLAQAHQLFLYNHRHAGGSDFSSEDYDSKDLATDCYQLIQKLELKKPAVAGISMGGMVAMQMAALYPEAVGAVILINTAIAGKQSIRPAPLVEKQMLAMPTGKIARFFFALKMFFPASERISMGFALIVNRFQPSNYTQINLEKVLPRQKRLLLKWAEDNATAKKIASLQSPVLILNGEADTVIPPENSLILARILKHSKIWRWTNGGHGMIYQYPEEMAEKINQFLAEQGLVSSAKGILKAHL